MEMANKPTECIKKTTIGGQALIEGLMMIGPEKKALAVRRPNGEIEVEFLNQKPPLKIEKIPFLRGSVKLFRQIVLGTKALMRSADLAEEVEEAEEVGELVADLQADSAQAQIQVEAAPRESFFDRHPQLFLYLTAIVSLGFSVALFILLPGLLVDWTRQLFNIPLDGTRAQSFGLTLIEGVVRIAIFVFYLWLVSRMKDIRRVWQYHGAEHKTIACYEAGQPLTVDHVREYSRLHPRCGTSFLFLVMIVSILVLAFVGWRSRLINLGIRILLLPVIAGISYEIVRFAGRYDNFLTRIISKPGLALQNLTTAEPEDRMLEVSIAAMMAVVPDDESDRW